MLKISKQISFLHVFMFYTKFTKKDDPLEIEYICPSD
jgi:hypothetical protein